MLSQAGGSKFEQTLHYSKDCGAEAVIGYF
jgi:hypothetical protein